MDHPETNARRRRAGARTLRAGDLVRVRPAAEILASLDERGRLDGMPFMPEMLQFAGRTVRVYKRADKACDTTNRTGLRRLRDTVHLEGLRCDGSAHGGCQAGCLLYWNERWLRRVDGRAAAPGPGAGEGTAPASPSETVPARPPGSGTDAGRVATALSGGEDEGAGGAPLAASGDASPTSARTGPSEADLARLTRLPSDGADRYVCQATELFAAARPLPWWDPTQYLRDVATGNATPRQVAAGILRWLSVRVQWRINRSGVPFVKGRLAKTPKVTLDLQPGERVRVRSRREIEATLDTNNRNRGLAVDADMMLFCGREFRVLRRVNRIIDERTRELIEIPGDCIVLDGATCTGAYNRCCPRSDYPYWREIWLSRVDGGLVPVAPGQPVNGDGDLTPGDEDLTPGDEDLTPGEAGLLTDQRPLRAEPDPGHRGRSTP